MGPTEFRFLITQKFEEVASPQFGDIVRYYTNDPVYTGLVYGGEIHAAIYVGREVITDEYGNTTSRDVALTKNGRSDLDFLVFQHIDAMDKSYLTPLPNGHALLRMNDGQDPRKKGYFRVKQGATILDPAQVGTSLDSYAAFLVDEINYRDRWACLAGRIDPPPGGNTSAYSFPAKWMTISWTD
jgi:hypothetical protein